jgi:uncharacterized protein YbjT (DUF2867 family)
MNIVVVGASGVLGTAITRALKARGHQVTTAGRKGCDVAIDFAHDQSPQALRPLVRGAAVVVNAAGILIERGQRFEDVHVHGPRALFAACDAERVARIVHISGLGLDALPASSRYAASKLEAERILADGRTDFVVTRLGVLVDPGAPASRAMRQLPGWALPGVRREPCVQALTLEDAAAAITHLCEHPKALRRTLALASEAQPLRQMLGKPSVRMVPTALALLGAHCIEAATRWGWLDQSVVSADNLRLLRDAVPDARAPHNLRAWLGREPSDPRSAFQALKAAGSATATATAAEAAPPSLASSAASRTSS